MMARMFGLFLWFLLNMACTVLPLIVLADRDDRWPLLRLLPMFALVVVACSWAGLVAYLLDM